MKFKVTFKDPDTLGDAIKEAAEKSLPVDLADDEREPVIEKRREKIADLCNRWFRYGEYVTIEIDTEARTATVISS